MCVDSQYEFGSNTLGFEQGSNTSRVVYLITMCLQDPTLQRSKDVVCAACHHTEAVFFQAEITKKSTALKLIFICCGCGYKWEG